MHRPHCAVVVFGHTGHGKTSLIEALLAAALPSRRHGDAAVKPVRLSTSAKRYTVFDVPGGRLHVSRGLRTLPMVQAMVLVVSSTAGPQAQTRELMIAAGGAGVGTVIVVINDFDGDRLLLDACELEVRSLLNDHGLGGDDVEIIVASLKSEPERAAAAVFSALDAVKPPRYDDEAPALVRVQLHHPGRSAATSADRSVSSGQLVAGTLRVGDAVRVVGLRDARTPLFFHHPRQQQHTTLVTRLRRWPPQPLTSYVMPSYEPPTPASFSTVARVQRLEIANRAIDVVGANEQVGIELSCAGKVPVVDRYTSVIVSANHPDWTQVVLTTLTLRPSALGGPRRPVLCERHFLMWAGAYFTIASLLPLDADGRVVDSAAIDSTFAAALVLSAPRFIAAGQPLVIANSAGIFATGVVQTAVGSSDAAGWFQQVLQRRLARDERLRPELFP